MAGKLYVITQYLIKQNLLNRMFPTEAPCLQHTIETLEMAGALVLREAFGTRAGISDVIACYIGRFIAFECKSATGEQSNQQQKFAAKVKAAGGMFVEVRCMSDVIKALDAAHSTGCK